jgi:hypothetical protein|tara:strand:+ start:3176 stop:3625 length:450 start_codon:yes stop_codon:yes gene_type:complete
MAFTGNFMCTSFKQQLLEAQHNFLLSGGDTFKIALYDNSASFTAATTDYTATNEVAASGSYSAGGGTLTRIDPATSGTTAFTDFADITFTSATITARGALIYNTTTGAGTGTTDTVVVLDFGSDKTSTSGDFEIVFPAADASNAIIRIA